MRWERVRFKMKTRETPDGRKSPGRKGGTAGPGKRWGHTCNSVKNGRYLYVFGGYGKDNRQTNDVHVFDTAKQTWSKPMVKGTPPSPRDSHSCTTVGASLYVFGGTDGKCPLQDLYILDTVTNTWSKPHLEGEGPAPREGHSAALIGHALFIFGGCGKSTDDSEEIYYNDLYILDTVKLVWTRATARGTAPAPRDSHTCSAWNNKLVVLGGEDASDSYLSDVYILDTDTMEWKELQTSGQKLMPRAGHATVSVGKHVFVFGGFTDDRKLFDDLHMLNIEDGIWTKVGTIGMGPSARFSVAGDCIDARSGILVFIGGCNENLEALDDMYFLDTELKVERGQDDRPEKFSLRKELKRKRQENQIVIKNPEKEKEMAPPLIDVKPRLTLNAVTPASSAAGSGSDKFSLYEFKPIEEKVFEAKITDVFHYGYTIESMIDGKQLRGLLFSYKPGFAHAVHAYLTRKKLSSDANVGKLREARKTKLRIARGAKHDQKQTDGQLVVSDQGNAVEEVLVTPSKQVVTFPDQYQQYMQQQQQNYHQQEPGMPVSASTANAVQQDRRLFMSSGYTGFPVSSNEGSHHQASGQPGIFAIRTLPSPVQGSHHQQPPSGEQGLQSDQQ